MTATTPKTVHQALAAVMAELPNIGKSDKSPEGYAYRGIEAVTKHLQPLLARHGVVIVPDAHIVATVPSPAMKDGWQDVIMHVDWTVIGPDGSTLKASTNGVGRDRSDKGANKAQTQAFKYLVLHLFCIADGKDDSDGHTYEADRRPEGQPSTGEQVAEFNDVLEQLSEVRRAELRAWFKKHRIPKVENATYDQASRAIEAANGLLPKNGSGGAPDSDAGDLHNSNSPNGEVQGGYDTPPEPATAPKAGKAAKSTKAAS